MYSIATTSAVAALRAEKDALRRLMRSTLRSLSAEQLANESLAVEQRLMSSDVLRRSRRVGIYVSCERLREVNTHGVLRMLLASGGRQRCFVPLVGTAPAEMCFVRIDSFDDLTQNRMGILEASSMRPSGEPRETVCAEEPLDVILVPGVAFDAQGRRLGRGGGYYDRFLRGAVAHAAAASIRAPLKVALAFNAQLLEDGAVPVETTGEHVDELVDIVITPLGVFGPAAASWM